VREVFGSIFVDLCMCIFRLYVSVNEYVCVDRFAWIGVLGSLTEIPVGLHGSVYLVHLLRFRFCPFVCVDRCGWIGVGCSLCEYICVDRWVWINVRDVLGSIFVDPCRCIFRGYVSVDEYVCVDRCALGSFFVDPCRCIFRGYVSVNEYVCVDRFAWIGVRGSLTKIPVPWICLCGSMCMDRGVLFAL